MKKILSVLLVLLILAAHIPTAFAAGSASISGPGEVRAGDTITLTFSAGGGILGGSGNVSYDASQLTLQSYSAAIGGSWAVEFGGNHFVFYDNSMKNPISGSSAIFRATFVVNKSLPAGTAISVSVNGITLSDGSQDIGMGSRSYSATIAPPLSGNCHLKSLTVSNAQISPAFSPETTSYSASVPFSVSKLTMAASAEDAKATVSVSNPSLTPGGSTNVTITVTAENGATKTYTIRVKREQDPNYVPSGNNNLSQITVEEYQLSPIFSAGVTQYYVWLPYETDTISLSATAEDPKATVEIAQVGTLSAGKGNNIAITVTAENKTQKIYTVTAVRAPAHDKTQDFLNAQPTEPVPTETTVPVETTQPQPATAPAPTQPQAPAQTEKPNNPLLIILIGIGCIAAGALVGIVIKSYIDSKKYKGKY